MKLFPIIFVFFICIFLSACHHPNSLNNADAISSALPQPNHKLTQARPVSATFHCDNNKISQFYIQQSEIAPLSSRNQSQSAVVSIYSRGAHHFYQTQKLTVNFSGKYTKVEPLIGIACPDVVYVQPQGSAHFQTHFDAKSISTLQHALYKFSNNEMRQALWKNLWQSVKAGQLELDTFLNIIWVNAPYEKDEVIADFIIQRLQQSHAFLELMKPNHQEFAKQASIAMTQMSLRLTMEASPNSALQSLWFNAYVEFAQSNFSLSHLYRLLTAKNQLNGISPLDQKRRWNIIRQLNRFQYRGSKKLLEQEVARDTSTNGKQSAISAQVVRPNPALKHYWLTRIFNTQLTDTQLASVMNSLYPVEQKELSKQTAEQRLNYILDLPKFDKPFTEMYLSNLLPISCSQHLLDHIDALTENPVILSQQALYHLHKAKLQTQTCIRIKTKMQPD
ncbi:MAG: ERAP1-like C-terminal domain-containing protein [Parashewanella sp.]